MNLDLSKLQNVQSNANGWTAMCPICAEKGVGLRARNQLSILRTGQFNCIIASSDDPKHNKAIRAFIKGEGNIVDVEYIDPEPRLTVDKVYPESTLLGLLPNYDYWIGRGMKEEVLRQLECGIAPKDTRGKLSGRTVFPIRNMKGQIMGFSGRLMEENSFAPKWKHAFRSSQAVYPWHITGEEIRRTRKAVLQESLGDIAASLSHGIKPIICTWGLNLSDLIISTLVAANVREVICSPNRDNNPKKGEGAAKKWHDKLVNFIPEVKIGLPNEPWNDWAECSEGGEAGAAELARFRAEVQG